MAATVDSISPSDTRRYTNYGGKIGSKRAINVRLSTAQAVANRDAQNSIDMPCPMRLGIENHVGRSVAIFRTWVGSWLASSLKSGARALTGTQLATDSIVLSTTQVKVHFADDLGGLTGTPPSALQNSHVRTIPSRSTP